MDRRLHSIFVRLVNFGKARAFLSFEFPPLCHSADLSAESFILFFFVMEAEVFLEL